MMLPEAANRDIHSRHEAFLDEYASWDRLAASIADEKEEPDLTPTEREYALSAVAYLRQRFGEPWLRQAFDLGHPFIELLLNRAPWTRVRIADLADAIQQVDALPLGHRTVDRYMAVDQQSGAVFELDLAATSLRKGLTVELEPPTQHSRNCDLAVTRPRPEGGPQLFIEMQAIQDLADSARRDMAVTERMAPTFMDREVLGQIYRIPADDELDTVLAATDAFWERCKTSTEPEHLQLEDVIDVWAVPYSHPARAELLAAGVPGDFKGPVGDDPLRRTLRAIRSKIRQLPTDAPGVIVLRPPKLLLLDPRSLPLVVMAIQQSVVHAPQISAVALVGWAFKSESAPNEARIPMSGAIVIHEPDRHIFMRQVILIPNSKRAYPAGDSIISLLF